MARPLTAEQLECLERIAGGGLAMGTSSSGMREKMIGRLIAEGFITSAHRITKKGQDAVKRSKLPKYWFDLLHRMERGQLTLCMRHAPEGGDDIYFIEPGGRDVPIASALRLIGSGYLVQNQDGMFGTTQTWRART